jgi:hypothetical protein
MSEAKYLWQREDYTFYKNCFHPNESKVVGPWNQIAHYFIRKSYYIIIKLYNCMVSYQKMGNKPNINMTARLPRSRRNISCDAMLLVLPFILGVFESQNSCYIFFYLFKCMRISFHPIFLVYDSCCHWI